MRAKSPQGGGEGGGGERSIKVAWQDEEEEEGMIDRSGIRGLQQVVRDFEETLWLCGDGWYCELVREPEERDGVLGSSPG